MSETNLVNVDWPNEKLEKFAKMMFTPRRHDKKVYYERLRFYHGHQYSPKYVSYIMTLNYLILGLAPEEHVYTKEEWDMFYNIFEEIEENS